MVFKHWEMEMEKGEEEEVEESFVNFNFKLTQPQNELQTWYEQMIAGYYRSQIWPRRAPLHVII